MINSSLDPSVMIDTHYWAVTMVDYNQHTQIIIEQPQESQGKVKRRITIAEFASEEAFCNSVTSGSVDDMGTGRGKPWIHDLQTDVAKYTTKGKTHRIVKETIMAMLNEVAREETDRHCHPTYYSLVGRDSIFSRKVYHIPVKRTTWRRFINLDRDLFYSLYERFRVIEEPWSIDPDKKVKYVDNILDDFTNSQRYKFAKVVLELNLNGEEMGIRFLSDWQDFNRRCGKKLSSNPRYKDLPCIIDQFYHHAVIQEEYKKYKNESLSYDKIYRKMKKNPLFDVFIEGCYIELYDQIRPPPMKCLFGWDEDNRKGIEVDEHNCRTWAEKKMRWMGIPIEPKTWYHTILDWIIALPSTGTNYI